MALSGKALNATSRLQQDYLRLKKDPVPYIVAEPHPSNICQWHYVVRGPEETPYEGGFYHGKLVFPRQFPFKPPSIYMITPNGRFKTNTRLCLSISDFHPDTWNPAWSVATILTGLLSFMVEVTPTFGSIETPDTMKKQLARKSLEFNLQDHTFCELFPDVVAEIERELSKRNSQGETHRDESVIGNERNGGILRGRLQVGQNGGQSTLYSAITNVCVLISFAAFVYSVKYVMRSLG